MNDRYASLAWAIFLCTGPAENIRSVSHCMTRLRLHLVKQPPDLIKELQQSCRSSSVPAAPLKWHSASPGSPG